MTDVKFWLLYINTWNHFIVYKKSSDTFQNVIYNICLQNIYTFNIYKYKQD